MTHILRKQIAGKGIEKYIEYNVVGFLIFMLFSDLKKVYFNITFEVILQLERESPYSMIF